MSIAPVFLSVVIVIQNQSEELRTILGEAIELISSNVSDFELIVVDNASEDDSLILLKELTSPTGFPNLQVYALTKEVTTETAAWVGLENALGDFVAVIDPMTEDLKFLSHMLEKSMTGADVVFANNLQKPKQTMQYRIAYGLFHHIYKRFNGIHLAKEAPGYRVLNKKVINFILQHPQPAITYRHLPATGGFARVNLEYSANPRTTLKKSLIESIERGMRLLVSTTHAPMRLVSILSLFGAAANLIYSIYVVLVGLFLKNVAPGWISLSLQQSGMFFLISLVLMVLGEYILNMASLSNEGPLYHISQEFTSARITRKEKLNIETAVIPNDSKDISTQSMVAIQ
jgi:glycosyltransferase involved in cell wall biosynthesis